MSSFLVLYGTGEGQTAKVAQRIASVLESRGHDSTTLDAEELPSGFSIDAYDAAIIGSSVHLGKHHDGIRSFVDEYSEALASLPTAFFQLSLSSAVDEPDQRAQAAGYVETLLETTGWDPDRIAMFGGALRYSKYGFLKRLVMKRIARKELGDVDTSRDYEYTDWEEVDDFVADTAAFVEARLGVTPTDRGEGE